MKETVKEILSAYRPGTSDDNDPVIQRALDAVEKDPELLEWFSQQMQMDELIRASLERSDAPTGILEKTIEFGQDLRPRKPWNRFWMPLAIAASLVLIGAFSFRNTIINNQILGYHPDLSKVDKQSDFRSAMGTWVSSTMINLDYLSEDPQTLNDWLGDRGYVQFESIPEKLEGLDSLGCKSFKWKNQQVSLVCFHTVDGKIVHLFMLEGTDDGSTKGLEALKEMKRVEDLQTRGWSDGERTHVLVGSDPSVDLSDILI